MAYPQHFHVLVVDDNEMNRDMLSRRLQRQGYVVDSAENGQIALEMLSSSNYDLILLDVMMPGLNGYEVLERVKADTALHDIPIIMISAVDDLESVVKCIEMGAEDYLFKPFNPVLLKARIRASLDRYAMQRERHQNLSASAYNTLSRVQERLIAMQATAGGTWSDEQINQLANIVQTLDGLLDTENPEQT